MVNLYDIIWGIGVGVTAPYWLIFPKSRRKVLGAFKQRMARDIPKREGNAATIMIHAVSLGEMNSTRALIQKLRETRPGLHFVVSATTETGFSRGQELYGALPD